MDDDRVTHPTADYGELFEGEETDFDTPFSEADVLGLENGLGIVNSRFNLNESQPSKLQLQQSSSEAQNHFSEFDNQISINTAAVDQVDRTMLDIKPSNLELVPAAPDEEDEDSFFGDEDEIICFEKEGPRKLVHIVKDAEYFARLKINEHLEHRGYREIILPNVMSQEAMAKLINPALYKSNLVLFGSAYQADDVYNEIDRFLKFYYWMKSEDIMKSDEIKPMLMPTLVFFFRESYLNGFKSLSQKLIEEFSRKILQEHATQENCLMAIAMSVLKSSRGFEDKYLQEVCQRQHKFILSEWTFRKVKKFLSRLKGTALIHILSNHFQIELEGTRAIIEDPMIDSKTTNNVSNEPDEEKMVLERLLGSVKANLPSIKVYTMNGHPASAAVSREASTFAYGMATSGIRICNVESAKKFPSSDDEDDSEIDEEYHPAIQTINGHDGAVYGLSFHPKTKLLYSVGQDCSMRAWNFTDINSVGCKCIYRGHYGPIWSVDITLSGHLIATASMDSTARIWIPERTDCVRILVGHYFDVDCVKFHPNESYLATGSIDKSARLWSVSDGEMVRVMTGVEGKIGALAFHKSGNYLIGGGDDNMIRVWDIREGELLAELPSLHNCKDLSLCGNMLAGCFQQGGAQVWNLRNIIGGDYTLNESVPTPHSVQSQGRSLISLYYKDFENLFCLGSDPILIDEDSDINTDDAAYTTNLVPPDELQTSAMRMSNSYMNSNSSPLPVYIPVNSIEEEEEETDEGNSNSPEEETSDVPPGTNLPASMSTDDIDDCLADADAENTNNTITSSDLENMEFEVDEQILQSFVDDNSLLQS